MEIKGDLKMAVNSNTKSTFNLKNVGNFLIAILPILFNYRTFVPGVNLAEMTAILLCVISFFAKSSNCGFESNAVKKFWIFYSFYICFISSASIIIYKESIVDVLIRTLRFSSYIWISVILIEKIVDIKVLMKWVLRVTVVLLVVILIQYFLVNTMGIKWKAYFSQWIYSSDKYGGTIENYSGARFRPSGLFYEPSYIGQYLFMPLCYSLLKFRNGKKDFVFAIIASVSMILSKSLWAYLLLAIIWAIWAVSRIISKEVKNKVKFIPVLILAPFIIAYLWRSSIVESALSRIDLNNITESASYARRFGGFDRLTEFSLFEKIMGIGFGNLRHISAPNYILYITIGIGFVGLSIFIILMIKSLLKAKTLWQKTIIGCLLLLCFGENIMLFTSCVLALSLGLTKINTHEFVD